MASKSVPARSLGQTAARPAPSQASRQTKPQPMSPSAPGIYYLRLYVAGQTRKSLMAIANLKLICEENLQGRYSIEVVDLLEHPHLARGEQILAIPTLVRSLPPPVKKIIGDLSRTDKVLLGLDVEPVTTSRGT